MDRDECIKKTVEKIQASYGDFDMLRTAYIFQQSLRRRKKCPIREFCLLFYPEKLFETTNADALKKAALGKFKTELGYKTDINIFRQAIKKWPEKNPEIGALVEKMAKKIAPNLTNIIGAQLTTKFLVHTNGLKRLATLSSAKIQVIGAEKALAAHKLHGKPGPKYGYIYNVLKKKTGKDARHLANKLAIAAKIDYFSGKLNKKFIKSINGPMMSNDIA